MAEMTALAALVISIVAAAMLKACHDEIKKNEGRINDLARQIQRLQPSSGREAEESLTRLWTEVPGPVVSTSTAVPEPRQEASAAPPRLVPAPPAPQDAPGIPGPPAAALNAVVKPESPRDALQPEVPQPQPSGEAKPLFAGFDRERWATLEAKLGKQWMTWVGAVALFLSVGFFVKYAFEHQWLNEGTRVILGVIAGMGMLGAGERFIRRQMRALGQGLVGAGLAILYVSLFAAYGLYGLLPQAVTFMLMALVTAGGVVLAVIHDAIAVSLLAVLGGLVTPVLLRTGRDPRDALFAYLFLLDLGVLVLQRYKCLQ